MFSVTQILNQDEGRLRKEIDAQKAPSHLSGFRKTSTV